MLQGLIAMVGAFPTLKEDYDQALRLIRRIWVSQFDVSEENRWEVQNVLYIFLIYSNWTIILFS